MIRTAFPDWELVVEDMVGEGDKVVTQWQGRGTRLGPFGDLEPTGRKIEIPSIAIDRIVDGKRVEGWTLRDLRALHRQLHSGNDTT